MERTKILRKNFLNASRGITLMVLIITIIIMLILTGVALNLGSREDGIFSKAQKAVSEMTIAKAKEESEMVIAKWVIQYHKEFIMNQTAAEYIEEKLVEGDQTSSGKFFVTVNDQMVRVYEGENADEANKVALGKMESSGVIEWTDFAKLPSGLNVGDYVTYEPSGTYNWQAKYASSDWADDGSADVILASGTEVTDETKDMSITSWKVFSINEVTGQIELLPRKQPSNGVRLQGAQGYNNAVKLLNDACDELYGNGTTILARSIDMEDIEGAMTLEALEIAHDYKGVAAWGEQIKNPLTAHKQYPTVYAKENLSVINGEKNTMGLGKSEQNELIERDEDGATLGKVVASASIQPYHTYWICDNAFMQTAFEGDGYSLLLPNGKGSNYWVASRCISTVAGYCLYHVFGVADGYVKPPWMCSSATTVNSNNRALFPIVSLSADFISGNDEAGWIVK